jgi:phosphoglycerate kinase
MAITYLDDESFLSKIEGQKVIARFDFNVPLDKGNSKLITDTTRIDLAIPTIKLILEQKPKKLILMSHLGRPKGKPSNNFSLEPVAAYLAEALDQDVTLTESCTDSAVKTLIAVNSSKIIMLQNLRFHSEEESNDHEFAKTLASYADLYVNDAFGTAHRKHASTYEINAFFSGNTAAGLLVKKEIEALSKITVSKPEAPFISIIGGAKIRDKIQVIEKLIVGVSSMLIGGAMAYPFLKAKGHNIGTSLCSDEDVKLAKSILARPTGKKIVLPIDHLVSTSPNDQAKPNDSMDIPDDLMGLDIGPKTSKHYASIISEAKTVLWNGPMGFFEKEAFSSGTFAIAEALSESSAYTIVGGGDSVSAVNKSGHSDKINHISTGGGASLEFIEQGTLPGIQALKFGIN